MIEYIRKIDQRALAIHQRFSSMVGAEHISSPIGLHVLIDIIGKSKPKRILEVGAGIGTLSCALLEYSDAQIDMIEDNSFCLQQLKKNISTFDKNRYAIFTDYNKFEPPSDVYDLMVVDGGSSQFLREVISKAKRIDTIFVEGNRGERRKAMRLALARKYVFTPREYRDAGKQFKGAHVMICRPSTSSIIRWLSYFYWEIRIFREIKLFIFHRLRKLFSLVV